MLLRAEGLGNHNSSGWRSKELTPRVWCKRFTLRVVRLLRAEDTGNYKSSGWKFKVLTAQDGCGMLPRADRPMVHAVTCQEIESVSKSYFVCQFY